MSRLEVVCALIGKLKSGENDCMEKHFRTLRDIQAATPDVSYQRLYRAANALMDAVLVHPWRGEHNELRFSLDDSLRLSRFFSLSRNGETAQTAVGELRSVILQEENANLRRENERLRALVEVTPNPWWMRLLRWVKIFRVRASSVGATLHH